MIKLGKELSRGDKIKTDDGFVTITANRNGMLVGHRMIEWRGGFGHIQPHDQIEVYPKEQD